MDIINLANTLPQSLAPATEAFLISASHSYLALFVTGASIALLGILTVLPIKVVRQARDFMVHSFCQGKQVLICFP